MQWRIGLFLAALSIGACEGSGGGGAPMGVADLPELAPVSRVELAPRSGATTVGGTVQFVATPLDRSGSVLSGRAVTWEAMNPSVAEISRGGRAQGLTIGTSVIKASVEGVNAFALLAVGDQRKPAMPDQPAR